MQLHDQSRSICQRSRSTGTHTHGRRRCSCFYANQQVENSKAQSIWEKSRHWIDNLFALEAEVEGLLQMLHPWNRQQPELSSKGNGSIIPLLLLLFCFLQICFGLFQGINLLRHCLLELCIVLLSCCGLQHSFLLINIYCQRWISQRARRNTILSWTAASEAQH